MVGGNPDVSTKLPSSQTQTQTCFKMTNPQAQGVNPVSSSKKIEKAAAAPTIPIHMLMPILRPHLDKDRDMQLQKIYSKLRSNEVSKEDFLRVIRNIVGDKMLRQAAHTVHLQMQAQATKPATSPNTNSSTSTSTRATSNSNPSPASSTKQWIGPGPGTGIRGSPGQVLGTDHQMSRADSNMLAASSGPQYPLSGVTKAPSKKPFVGQKKPAEACTSLPTSKKQKTGGTFLDQSVKQFNDVTAVSGVNLRAGGQQWDAWESADHVAQQLPGIHPYAAAAPPPPQPSFYQQFDDFRTETRRSFEQLSDQMAELRFYVAPLFHHFAGQGMQFDDPLPGMFGPEFYQRYQRDPPPPPQ